jgi:thiamine-monophosphate kinase
MQSFGEIEVIEALQESTRVAPENVVLGIGDDAAVTKIEPGYQLVTATDVIAAGTHYPEGIDAQAIGHRSLAVNLSDIAAMGATPVWANLIFSVPVIKKDWVDKFILGFSSLANANNVTLIGGDTIRGPEFFAVSLQGIVADNQYISRAGAQLGDSIYVSGFLGDASHGREIIEKNRIAEVNASLVKKFLYPTPRMKQAKELNQIASSMIDLSDGLYSDLGKILSESNKGARIDVSKLPISETLTRLLGREKSIEKALIGGDDYELCFTVPKIKQNQFDLFAQSNKEIEYTPIGEITSENELKLLDQGSDYSLTGNPYSHF